MPFRSRLRSLAAALFVIAAGALADRAQLGAATCNNDCRLRQEHYFCPTGTDPGVCFKLFLFSCNYCQPGFTYRCENRDPWASNCGEPLRAKTTLVEFYDSCDLVCDCAAGISIVEAKNMSGQTTNPSTARYVCTGP